MKNLLILILLSGSFAFTAKAQVLRGKVYGRAENRTEPLAGAAVVWISTGSGVSTGPKGEFTISLPDAADRRLVFSYIGFIPDTLVIKDTAYREIVLKGIHSGLSEVEIKGKRASSFVSTADPMKTEVITQAELTKAACCDLAGCFETQGTVQPTTTNIITNSRELRILGLSGVYNQVLTDGMPMIQGLTYTYGISSIPGTLIENIYVSKGANSVLQGAESITGQINVTLKEPDQTDRLMVNAYANSFLEKQFNLNYAHKLNNWSSLAAVHAVLPADRFDRDGDNLLDLPLIRRYSVYNKWKYKTEDSIGFHTRFAFRLLSEKRTGGQQDFDEEIHKGSRSVYGQTVDITQPEFYTKTGFRFNEGNALSLLSSLSLHRQDSWFGNLSYEAEQTSANVTLQYEKRWLERHDLKTGVSYRHLYISENIRPADSIPLRTYYGSYRKNERTPGLFAENTFHWKEDKYVLITGVRLDNNSGFGYFLVPRTMLKYTLSENYILRASLGYGYRTVNLFSENVNLLASSRDVSIRGILHPEEAINWGVNFTGKIPWENIEGSYGLDFYQTRFLNQVYVDYDSNPLQAVVSDFSGISVSNGFQAETNLRFYERAELRLSYTWLDVYRIAGGLRDEIPFNPRHKILSALSYSPVSERWQADLNIHWYGRQRLPVTTANPEEFRRESFSDPYYTVNIQLTKKWERLQLYAGCENIFDFRQLRPVMGWENPFGPYFDTSFAWGPTRGREAYLGVRLTY